MRCETGTSGITIRTGGGGGGACPGRRPNAARTSRKIASRCIWRCMLVGALLPEIAKIFLRWRRQVALAQPRFHRRQHFETWRVPHPRLLGSEHRCHFPGQAVNPRVRHSEREHPEREPLELVRRVFSPRFDHFLPQVQQHFRDVDFDRTYFGAGATEAGREG